MATTTVLTVASIAVAAVGVGTSIYSLVSADDSESATLPAATSQAAVDTSAEQAAYAEQQALQRRRGAAATILTGPGGVTSTPTTLKTRLGD